MKTRFTSLDIRVLCAQLRKILIGLRLANIYDLNSKNYLFKFAKLDGKSFLLIESGIRMHTTDFERSKADVPSQFTLKLRKHLRTRRLENIQQLGTDRVVDFTFGSGPATHHLIIEFYATGNVILTDSNYEILTLLRTHKYDDGTLIAAHQKYPIDKTKQLVPITKEYVESLIASAEPNDTLKSLFNKRLDFGAALIDHCLQRAGIHANLQLPKDWDSAKHLDALVNALKEGEKAFHPDDSQPAKGYIVLAEPKQPKAQPAAAPAGATPKKEKGKGKKGGAASDVLVSETASAAPASPIPAPAAAFSAVAAAPVIEPISKESAAPAPASATAAALEKEKVFYDEFHPMLFEQIKPPKRQILEFDSFDKAVDEFFSKMEGQKLAIALNNQEHSVADRLAKVTADQSRRIEALQQVEMDSEYKAKLIEQNLDDVDKAILIIRSYVATGMDWQQLGVLLKDEKKKGNPIAGIIHRLKLESNQITLLLNETHDGQSEEEMTAPAHQVDVDISLSAHANACSFYDQKKKSSEKKQKTVDAAEQALRAAEKKARTQLKEVKVKASIQQLRKVHWFEKFHWFISSENYVVIAGRDAQQNELIVKRYMRKGDLYVHADLHGAATCIIKNPSGAPVPPVTLQEAGCMTVCRSAAWTAKVVTSAYWVYDHQVSKTAPTGEYLTTGSFMIRGKKNFLPPAPLIMGFGLLFKVDESSVGRHLNERVPKTGADDLAAFERYGLEQVVKPKAEGSPASAAAGGDGEKHLRRFERRALRKEQKAAGEEGEASESSASEAETPAAPAPASATAASSSSSSGPIVSVLTSSDTKKWVTADVSSDDEAPAASSAATASSCGASVDAAHKPKLSAAERRKMKRAQGAPAEPAPAKPAAPVVAKAAAKQAGGKAPAKPAPPAKPAAAKQSTRGKRGKLKKMKEKYKDQDEDERRLKMKLLGNELPEKEGEDEEEAEEAIEEAAPAAASSAASEEPAAAPAAKADSDAEEIPAAAEESSEDEAAPAAGAGDGTPAASGGRKGKREAKQKEQEEIRKILAEENVMSVADEAMEKNDLVSLTGQPVAEDILLYAIPVCGPYTAMTNYKFKVKLTPGSQKKGKAAKTGMEMFLRATEASNREKELMKAIAEMDVIQCMIGDVKVSTPGLYKNTKGKKK